MFFRRLTAGVVFATLTAILLFACSACTAPKGGIVIVEHPNGTEFAMDFKEWSAGNKCELSLRQGDELQLEMIREAGGIALTIRGKNGSEPYTGRDLCSGLFTVTVPETDVYVFTIRGSHATGNVTVKNLGREQ